MERLAVLPPTDLSNDPAQDYVTAGVYEALIAELGQLGLSVTARRTIRINRRLYHERHREAPG